MNIWCAESLALYDPFNNIIIIDRPYSLSTNLLRNCMIRKLHHVPEPKCSVNVFCMQCVRLLMWWNFVIVIIIVIFTIAAVAAAAIIIIHSDNFNHTNNINDINTKTLLITITILILKLTYVYERRGRRRVGSQK